MRTVILALAMLAVSQNALAADATSVWGKILKNCAKTDVIGERSLFFGASNTIGPGSVWRVADDKSLRLMFELSDAFPDPAVQAALVKYNNVVTCVGNSTSNWSLKLGLPFTTGATPLLGEIAAFLGRAKSVTVSITGYSVDLLKGTEWGKQFSTREANDPYVVELKQANRVLAENAIKVTGLRAVFTFGTKVAADVRTKITEQSSTAADTAKKDDTAGQTRKGNGGAPEKPQESTDAAKDTAKDTAKDSSKDSKPADRPAAAAAPGACDATALSGQQATNGVSVQLPSGATPSLHLDFVSDNQIVLCAPGPFYLIAAFSRLVDGKAVGAGGASNEPLLIPATVARTLEVKTDRKTR